MPGGSSARPSWFARNPVLTAFLAVIVFFGGAAAVGDDDPGDSTTAASSTGSEVSGSGPEPRPKPRQGQRRNGHDKGEDGSRRQPVSEPAPNPAPNPPAPSTFLVTRVVDGDTIELGNGRTVRLAGIDTPEVGECGFEESSAALGHLVLGRQVTLGESDEDVDQYGRLLRYVDVGRMDAGLTLIKRGLAIARYDSRDGYGYHPREASYVRADSVSKDFGCPPPAQPVPLVGGGRCAPGYSPCIPAYPPDVDCPDVDGPIKVTGDDPHGLDADGDGWACES